MENDIYNENVNSITKIDCPICGKKNSLKIINNELDLPYIGKVLESTIICDNCNYRTSDVMPLDEKEPKRYILKIESEDDLKKRVVRSSKGHIFIPELGFEVKPGVASEGYVSNVEGVLNRLYRAINILKEGAENKEDKLKCDELIEKLDKIKEGKEQCTLIIEDPSGHSVIIGDNVIEEKLTEEDIKRLQCENYVQLKK